MRTSAPDVDALAARLHGGLARQLVAGAERDLLAPLRFLPPGERPSGGRAAVDRSELARGARDRQRLLRPSARRRARGEARRSGDRGRRHRPADRPLRRRRCSRWSRPPRRCARPKRSRPPGGRRWRSSGWRPRTTTGREVASATFAGRDGPARLDARRRSAAARAGRPAHARRRRRRRSSRLLAAAFRTSASRTLASRAWPDCWRPEARFGEAFARQMVAALRRPRAAAARRDAARAQARRARRTSRVSSSAAARSAPRSRRDEAAIVRARLRAPGRRRSAARARSSCCATARGGGSNGAATTLRAARRAGRRRAGRDAARDARRATRPWSRPASSRARRSRTPCSARVCRSWGRARLAYLAQAAAVYALLGVARAVDVAAPAGPGLRPARSATQLAELGVPLAELIADPRRPSAGWASAPAAASSRRRGRRSPPRSRALARAGGGARSDARAALRQDARRRSTARSSASPRKVELAAARRARDEDAHRFCRACSPPYARAASSQERAVSRGATLLDARRRAVRRRAARWCSTLDPRRLAGRRRPTRRSTA